LLLKRYNGWVIRISKKYSRIIRVHNDFAERAAKAAKDNKTTIVEITREINKALDKVSVEPKKKKGVEGWLRI